MQTTAYKEVSDSAGREALVAVTQVQILPPSSLVLGDMPKRVPRSFNPHETVAGAKLVLDFLQSREAPEGPVTSDDVHTMMKLLRSPEKMSPLVRDMVISNAEHRMEYNRKRHAEDETYPLEVGMIDLVANYEVSDLMKEFNIDCQFLRYNKYSIIDQATGELLERMEAEEKRFGGSIIGWYVDINYDERKGESEFIIDTPKLSLLQTPKEYIDMSRDQRTNYKVFVLDENGHFGFCLLFKPADSSLYQMILFDTTMKEIQTTNKIVDVALKIGMCSML